MALSTVQNIKITGMAAAVPGHTIQTISPSNNLPQETAEKIAKNTGVRARKVTPKHLCTSDLCFEAARTLLNDTTTNLHEIDALLFVTQTSDYILPATSCILQNRLGLSKSCAAFDINQGCSGYVYGLWIASSLLAGGGANKVLLLVGDTISKMVDPADRSTALLFGDAGTATIVERTGDDSSFHFVLGTDGAGADYLKTESGGFRHGFEASPVLRMNGPEILSFTLSSVAPMLSHLLAGDFPNGRPLDAVVLHQANEFITRHLGKKCGVPTDKLIIDIAETGNTSSASIPLSICRNLRNRITKQPMNLILAGFGVGLSWAGVRLTTGPFTIPEIVTVQ